MTNEESRKKLSPIMKQFTKEYPLDFNGTEAYLRASAKVGGKTTQRKTASVQASKLLKLPKVKEMVEAYVQEQLGPLEKDLLGNVKFWIEIRNDTEARPADRLKASEMLAKYRSMFVEKKDLTVTASVQIVDDV